MAETSERALDRLAVGAWLGVAVLALGYLGVALLVVRLVEREHRLGMLVAVKSEARDAEQHLAEVVEDLRRRVNERAATDASNTPHAAHPALYRLHVPLVCALLEVGSDGAIVAAAPAGWTSGSLIARQPAVARALATGTVAVGSPFTLDGGIPAFVIALAIPASGTPPQRISALVAVVDLSAFRSLYLEPLLARPGEWAALVAGAASEPTVVARDESRMPAPQPVLDRAAWSGLVSGRVSRIDTKDGSFLASAPARFEVGGEPWSIVLFRPHRAVLTDARRVLLLTGFFVIVAVAVGSAMAVAWRRHWQALQTARKDARRWREIAGEVQHEERWRIIAEEAWEPIVFLRGTKVGAANVAAVEGLRLAARADLLGMEFSHFMAEEDRPAFERRLASLEKQPESTESFRCTLLTASGDRRVADMAASVVAAQPGRMIRLSWQDLTSRERAEALLRTLSAAAPVGVALFDPKGKLLWANSVASTATGQPVDRHLGRSVLALVEPRDRRRAITLVARAAQGRTREGLLHIRSGPGEVVPLVVRAVPVNVAGAVDGVLAIAWDSTTVPSLSGWEKLPDGVLLGQLGSVIAHRLNNDLQALLGVVERLPERGRDSDDAVEARQLVERTAHLIQQFGVLSRLGTTARQRVSVAGLVETWLARVRPTLPTSLRIAFRRDLDDDGLDGDGAQISLLLDLALAAALPELTRGGTFEVSIEAPPQEGYLRLSIFDTGTAEHREGRTDVDVPWPASPAREMVRAVARLVARHHGGTCGSKSSVALGHRLWCDLARSEGRPAVAAGTTARAAGVVLVADDEDLVRAGLVETLRLAGYVVEEATNGREAVDLVRADRGRYALVVLDLVMPVMDGREALRLLREVAPGLPILVCTGYDPAEDPVLSSAAVAIKPLTGTELVDRVAALVSAPPGNTAGDGTMNQ